MKFDINTKTNKDFKEMINAIHSDESEHTVNWEVAARLWFSDKEKTVMVEHQVMTARGKINFESPNEPDWFTAYIVKDEQDDDCGNEIDTEYVGQFNTIDSLKTAMEQYAKAVIS